MNVGFAACGVEEHPVLLDGGTRISGISGQFCEGRVGFERSEGWAVGVR